jgi:hypothetical protein
MVYKKINQIYNKNGDNKIEIKHKIVPTQHLSNPEIWGPSFWFTLHNCANNYPVSANNIYKKYSKGFIQGIPFMIPCKSCAEHAKYFIQKHNLDLICSGKEEMFVFFWKFHNEVNKRHGKKELSLEKVKEMYSKNAKMIILNDYE